jgi:hypothetical protein
MAGEQLRVRAVGEGPYKLVVRCTGAGQQRFADATDKAARNAAERAAHERALAHAGEMLLGYRVVVRRPLVAGLAAVDAGFRVAADPHHASPGRHAHSHRWAPLGCRGAAARGGRAAGSDPDDRWRGGTGGVGVRHRSLTHDAPVLKRDVSAARLFSAASTTPRDPGIRPRRAIVVRQKVAAGWDVGSWFRIALASNRLDAAAERMPAARNMLKV